MWKQLGEELVVEDVKNVKIEDGSCTQEKNKIERDKFFTVVILSKKKQFYVNYYNTTN